MSMEVDWGRPDDLSSARRQVAVGGPGRGGGGAGGGGGGRPAPPPGHGSTPGPTFNVSRVDYVPPFAIRKMAISNGVLVIALDGSRIIRLDLSMPDRLENIQIGRHETEQVSGIFLDPTGTHLLVSLESEETYYLHKSWSKDPKNLSKLKGEIVTAVSWSRDRKDEFGQKHIMLGTNKGQLFDLSIEGKKGRSGELTSFKDHTKHLFDLGQNSPQPIIGLLVQRFPDRRDKKFVMVATLCRLYQFVGTGKIGTFFQPYERDTRFRELPGLQDHSELHFAFQKKGERSVANAFAWLTGAGIFHGDLAYADQEIHDSVSNEASILPYPKADGQRTPSKSICMTDFNYVLLYNDNMKIISRITGEPVFNHSFTRELQRTRPPPLVSGEHSSMPHSMIGVAQDFTKGLIFMYSQGLVFELTVANEGGDVWEQFLQKGDFEKAALYAPTPAMRSKVFARQAEHVFDIKEYDEAASLYGRADVSFEEVALKFIHSERGESDAESRRRHDALRIFLTTKLNNLSHAEEPTQRTMIATWLVEVYISKLNQIDEQRQRSAGGLSPLVSTSTGPGQTFDLAELNAQFKLVRGEMLKFLLENQPALDPHTTFALFSSHGRIDDLLAYAAIIKEFEKVISYHVQHGQYPEALEALANQGDPKLYYRYAPILITHLPVKMIELLIRSDFLSPSELIPALMRYDHSSVESANPGSPHHAIRYLEHVVYSKRCKDMAVHNYLVSLYANVDKDDRRLLGYLDLAEPRFDLDFALRLCSRLGKWKACIIIFGKMGLYEEAVRLALKVDLGLAKQNANKPVDDEELRKKLWLLIARHVVEEEKDIKKAMDFLQECELLRIEDILPFFPDFVLIDDFKDEICKSLEDYNRHIEELKKEMITSTNSAELIRQDILSLRDRYGIVRPNQLCQLTEIPVVNRAFYMFPCGHAYLESALADFMMRYLKEDVQDKVLELRNALRAARGENRPTVPLVSLRSDNNQGGISSTSEDSGASNDERVEEMLRLQRSLDELVAFECPMCGSVAIQSIGEPFISAADADVIESWGIL